MYNLPSLLHVFNAGADAHGCLNHSLASYGKPSLCLLHLQAAVMRSGLLGSERSGGAVQCELDDEGAIRAFTMGGIRDVHIPGSMTGGGASHPLSR